MMAQSTIEDDDNEEEPEYLHAVDEEDVQLSAKVE